MKVVDIFQRVESECERVLESEREREKKEVGGELTRESKATCRVSVQISNAIPHLYGSVKAA